ncbi:zinc-finger domain-containing protein [Candidatus Legionella polyplacis]|uniref:Zinc-finger domain-containing protein n=1 Tax=Candidatus Legionella polyplacis TaxID=2005262 RepID=A0ABZ2GVH2_9GAMM
MYKNNDFLLGKKKRFFKNKKEYLISKIDLPLSCPNDRIKNKGSFHPKVYLSIKKMGMVICPYCRTKFIYM